MNKLHQKLQKESDHIRLTAAEKSAMRERIFGLSGQGLSGQGAPAPMRVTPTPYFFMPQQWMVALASLVLVVFAGSSTAFAAQGALPGQPLYAVKTKILEPVQVALASSPADKAAVHVAIAQTRVEEAEALAQKGQLTASTSAALADNFDANAQSATELADQVAAENPAVATEIKTQLSASSVAGSAVLVALADKKGGDQPAHAQVFASRILARADSHTGGDTGTTSDRGSQGEGAHAAATLAVSTTSTPEPKANVAMNVHLFAATTAGTSSESVATSSQGGEGERSHIDAKVSAIHSADQDTAAQLEAKAQAALDAARAQYASASSTLNASTTVAVEAKLSGIESLISQGSSALGDTLFDTALKDFTDALSQAYQLSSLLKAQQTFDNQSIIPLLNSSGGHDSGDGH